MKRSGSSTNALLDKVSSQLKGERVKKVDDEDEALNVRFYHSKIKTGNKIYFDKEEVPFHLLMMNCLSKALYNE